MSNITCDGNNSSVISESIYGNRSLSIFNGLHPVGIFFQGGNPVLGASMGAKVEAKQLSSGGNLKFFPFEDVFSEPLFDASLHLHRPLTARDQRAFAGLEV